MHLLNGEGEHLQLAVSPGHEGEQGSFQPLVHSAGSCRARPVKSSAPHRFRSGSNHRLLLRCAKGAGHSSSGGSLRSWPLSCATADAALQG